MRQRHCRGVQADVSSLVAASEASRVGNAGQSGVEERGQGELCNAAWHKP